MRHIADILTWRREKFCARPDDRYRRLTSRKDRQIFCSLHVKVPGMSDFWEAHKTVKSPNGFSLLRIDADISFTPSQLQKVAQSLPEKDPPDTVLRWVNRRNDQSGGTLLQTPKAFHSHWLADTIELSTAGGPPDRKNLLIAFMGLGSMFMMPKSVFLQQFDDAAWDVVGVYSAHQALRPDYDLAKVKREKGAPFFEPGGFAQQGQALAKTLARLIDIAAYRSVISAGVSSGGALALQVGDHLAANLSVAISSRLEAEESYRVFPRPAGSPPRKAHVFHAADNERDAANCLDVAQRSDAKVFAIPGVKRHNPFKKAMRQGNLHRLLPALLDPRKDPAQVLNNYERTLDRNASDA